MVRIIKNVITICKAYCNCLRLIGGGNYIGVNVKFINRGTIRLYGNVIIRPSSHIYTNTNDSEIAIGKGTEIGNHSTVSAKNKIVFEKNVLTGPHVFVSDHNHEYVNPNIAVCKQGVKCHKNDKVIIGEGSWIGTNVVIVGNVKIGKQCVIGANSVVTKDIPDYCVAVGIPAKVVKKYNVYTGHWERI